MTAWLAAWCRVELGADPVGRLMESSQYLGKRREHHSSLTDTERRREPVMGGRWRRRLVAVVFAALVAIGYAPAAHAALRR